MSSGGGGVPANLTLTAPASATVLTIASGATLTTTGAFADTLAFPGAFTYTFPNSAGTVLTNQAASLTSVMGVGSGGGINFNGGSAPFEFNGIKVASFGTPTCTAPTGATGGACAVTTQAGSYAQKLTLSVTSGSFTGTTMTVTFPNAALDGYVCEGIDYTTNLFIRTENGGFVSTTQSTLTFRTPAGVATAPGTADVLYLHCVMI